MRGAGGRRGAISVKTLQLLLLASLVLVGFADPAAAEPHQVRCEVEDEDVGCERCGTGADPCAPCDTEDCECGSPRMCGCRWHPQCPVALEIGAQTNVAGQPVAVCVGIRANPGGTPPVEPWAGPYRCDAS